MHYDQELTQFSDLDETIQASIIAGLRKELNLSTGPEIEGVLEFRRADIPIKGHDTHARGKLAEFLQELFPEREFRIIPLFRTLLSEVANRNNNLDQNQTYDDFLKHKALSRRRFTEILKRAGVSDKKPDLQEVLQRLNSEGALFPLVKGVRQDWDGVLLDRLARRDVPHLRLWESVKEAVDANVGEGRLLDLIAQATAAVQSSLSREWGYSDNYVKTCIIIEAYERQ